MISLPTPPTDNLYKFMAIAGIVLFIVGLTLPWILDQRELEWYWQTFDAISGRMNDRAVFFTKMLQADPTAPQAMDWLGPKVMDALDSLQAKELGNFQKKCDEREVMRTWRSNALGWTKWGGVVLAIAGFALWWLRVQRYQDELLRVQFQKARLELMANLPDTSPHC